MINTFKSMGKNEMPTPEAMINKNNLDQSGEKLKKEQATEIESFFGTLENAVNKLIERRERGENVFCNFNGHKLFSADVTMDSAFLEVTGQNKTENDKAQKEWHENYKRKEKEEARQAEAKIPGWIEMGKILGVKPELTEEWEKMVKIRAGDLYHGIDLDAAIEVMLKINDGATAEDIKNTLDNQGHSGASYGMVHSIVTTFSPLGKDIFEEIDKIEK